RKEPVGRFTQNNATLPGFLREPRVGRRQIGGRTSVTRASVVNAVRAGLRAHGRRTFDDRLIDRRKRDAEVLPLQPIQVGGPSSPMRPVLRGKRSRSTSLLGRCCLLLAPSAWNT